MAEQKSWHTPGPWSTTGAVIEWHRGGFGGGVEAAAVWAPEGPDRTSSPVAWVHPYLSLGDPAADARLIAAAPDLLNACRQGVAELLIAENLIEHPSTDPIAWVSGVRMRLESAIAKAEGR